MTMHRLAEHLRVPLFRSGYALASNTVVTSGLGAVYWVLAARLLSPDDVGVGAALISAMTLLTTLTVFNLDNALNRFVPPAGAATARLILGSYAFAVPLAGVAAVVFLVGIDWWAAGLDVITSSGWAMGGFVAATMLWTVFVLQDAALAGLRKAPWLPVENGLYGVAKIVLLVVFAAMSARFSVFASWTVPLLAVVVAVNYLMFRRAVPAHIAATTGAAQPFRRRQVVRYAAKDYVASAMWTATAALLPIIVLDIAGAEANAYFYLAWTIAYTLYLVSRSTGVALITEGALEPAKLIAYSRQVIGQTSVLIVPSVLVVVVAAPLILSIFGPDYAREGSTVLRLLVLAAIPNMAVTLFISIARVERRMRSVLYVNAAMLVGVVTLSVLLLPSLGVVGVGWAWLAVQTVLAVVLLATGLRRVWIPIAAEVPALQRLAAKFGPGRRLGRESSAAAARLPALLTELGHDHPELDGLQVGHMLPTELDLVVASLADAGGQLQAVIKLAATEGATAGIEHEAAALVALHGDGRLASWVGILPSIIARGRTDGLGYFVEDFIAGESARDVAADAGRRAGLVIAAAEAVAPLHALTGRATTVDASSVDRWVHEPFADLVRLLGGPQGAVRERRCRSVAAQLEADLLGSLVEECWIHGDYWLGNLLVHEDGRVAGIVDWGQAEERALPALDVLHLVLTARVLSHDQPFGATVLTSLADPEWNEAELAVLQPWISDSGDHRPSLRSLILLTWLRHVASNVRKSYRYRRSDLWMGQNVDEVLEFIS